MPGTATGDEVSGKTSPLDGRHKVLKPLEPPADASAGRTFPVPLLVPSPKPGSHRRGPPTGKYKSTTEKKAHEPSEYMRQRTKEMQQAGKDASAGRTFPVPLLVPSPKPGSHRRGPLRGKKKATGHKEADEPNNILKQMVEELHKGNAEPVGEGGLASQPTFRIEPLGHGEVMEQKAGQKAVFPQASRGRLAAPAAGEEEMPDMGTGTGGAASPTTRVLDSQKGPGRGFWIGLIAGLLFLELIFILCCVQIWTCWKRKGDASADSQDWPNTPAMGNWSCHLASPSPCLLSLPRLHYQLIARDSLLVSPPRAGASVPKGAAPGVQPGQEVQPSYQGRA
ncbi:uncharacterized protein LOC131088295 isoform X4 [Melospiza georgiana]|uniref:uncharacterized protein LOC131088295 isoform X4 n=1 Tax=Melospiza georgiana TaxID=44398 RepID=UPI0025AC9567|nr:uncharacterized protein LOC131088295 isoform X4 [Melospiza georgiana]